MLNKKPTVLIDRLEEGDRNLKELFQRFFSASAFESDLGSAKAIFIKPNLTYPSYKKGVTTRTEFVEALVSVIRGINASTKIYIGEGEGGYNSYSMTQTLKDMGYFGIEEHYPNIEIVNLSKLPSREVELKAHGKPYSLSLPSLLLDEIDFSISCPVPKVHCMTKITLAFKNHWGCLPDTMRLKNHYVFDEIISQVCDKLKLRYAFLDGKYGLDNNGPMDGDPVEVNWFAAADSPGAFEMIVSEMMGFNWKKIGHMKAAAKYGYMPDRGDIPVEGDIESLKKNFVLKRDVWNYPALIAFQSKKLTHFVYLSKWAKIIHDIMYLFRKRPLSSS